MFTTCSSVTSPNTCIRDAIVAKRACTLSLSACLSAYMTACMRLCAYLLMGTASAQQSSLFAVCTFLLDVYTCMCCSAYPAELIKKARLQAWLASIVSVAQHDDVQLTS